MRDKEGLEIRCKYSDWKVVDQRDNRDFVCTKYCAGGTHLCYCDEYCRDYVPAKMEENEDKE